MKHLPSNFRWSFSKIASYLQCPRSFYLTYIEEERDDALPSFYGQVGTWCHKLLEEYAKDKIPSFSLAEEFANGYETNVTMSPPKFPKNIWQNTYDQCLAYFEQFDGFGDEWEVISVEDKFVIKLDNKFDVSGIADLVLRNKNTGAIRIVDHKTKSQSSLSKEINLYRKQLYLYAHWSHERFGQWPQDVCFNMIRTQKMIIEPFSLEEHDKAMQWFVDTIQQIQIADIFEDWDCKISKFFCQNICDVSLACPEWQEVRQADYEAWKAKKEAEEAAALGY